MSDPAHRTVESRNTAVIHEADVPFYQIVKPKLNYGYWDQQERSSNEESWRSKTLCLVLLRRSSGGREVKALTSG